MNIENEIWKKCQIHYDDLIAYGFQKQGNIYLFQKNILENTFRVEIQISEDGIVKGKIYDIEFGGEYTNYRREGELGAFASQVKETFINLLLDIKKHCTCPCPFASNQANRLTALIYECYHDAPEFPWEGEPHGIFRNPNNQKWYGLIMNIDKSRISKDSGEVEILNVKLEESEIQKLQSCHGFYPAYHMNKKNWITIILDDTLSDEEIMKYIHKSHELVSESKEWIIPANPKYYDVIHCFDHQDTVLWKQSNHMEVNDIVYLYVAAPYSAILYRCQVLQTDIPYSYQSKELSMSKVMKLKRLNQFDEKEFSFDILKKYGVTSIRGPRSIPSSLRKELLKKSK